VFFIGAPSVEMNSPLVVLKGWKEIAKYLGAGVRSVQRYERAGTLPIRRPTGQSRGAVFATKSELDTWVHASSLKDAFTGKPTCAQNHDVAFGAFKTVLAEHRRLRQEMQTDKEKLGMAVELLHATLVVVQEECARKLERPSTVTFSASETITWNRGT